MGEKHLKIVWTETAKQDLQAIFDYLSKISDVVADKQIMRIIESVSLLAAGFDLIGQKEPLLAHHKNVYRYLVQDNYKVIYHPVDQNIVIDMIFDTRQNPEKLSIQT